MKYFTLWFFDLLSFFWRLFPSFFRHYLISSLLLLDSRDPNPSRALHRVFRIVDFLDLLISERAIAYGSGHHPKHRLTNYHLFFIERISPGQSVLDVGCGIGAVAMSVAISRPTCNVIGIDVNQQSILHCRKAHSLPNLAFYHCDATLPLTFGFFDVVILSNILEHISSRTIFLESLLLSTRAHTFLIRVPLFERHWHMPLRVEIGVNYLSDPDHKIEYSLEEFKTEIHKSGLQLIELLTMWGEIWAQCRPIPSN